MNHREILRFERVKYYMDNIQISTTILAMALTIASEELSKYTGEPALEIKKRLTRSGAEKFKGMNFPNETNEWVKTNYPLPFTLKN